MFIIVINKLYIIYMSETNSDIIPTIDKLYTNNPNGCFPPIYIRNINIHKFTFIKKIKNDNNVVNIKDIINKKKKEVLVQALKGI